MASRSPPGKGRTGGSDPGRRPALHVFRAVYLEGENPFAQPDACGPVAVHVTQRFGCQALERMGKDHRQHTVDQSDRVWSVISCPTVTMVSARPEVRSASSTPAMPPPAT